MSDFLLRESITPQSILEAISRNHETLHKMGVRKLGLFGSYARGEQKSDSDMDFVVVLARYTLDNYMDTKFFLEDLFDVEIDLIPEDSIKPRLRPHIMREVQYAEGFESLS